MTDKGKTTRPRSDEPEGYKRLGEPKKTERASIWQIAIGLQQADGPEPSEYLTENAKRNICGDITTDEVITRLDIRHRARSSPLNGIGRTEEADKVSTNITKIFRKEHSPSVPRSM